MNIHKLKYLFCCFYYLSYSNTISGLLIYNNICILHRHPPLKLTFLQLITTIFSSINKENENILSTYLIKKKNMTNYNNTIFGVIFRHYYKTFHKFHFIYSKFKINLDLFLLYYEIECRFSIANLFSDSIKRTHIFCLPTYVAN